MVKRLAVPLQDGSATVELAFEDRGNGPPVVLVHGFPLNRTMWVVQMEALASHFRVIVPDLRGFGESQVVPGVATMDTMAGDLVALLDVLGISEKIVLGGLSMGGYVALAFARRYPERLRGLILCDTRAKADSAQAKENRRRVAERVLQEGPSFIADEMIPRLCCEKTFRTRPEVIEKLRTMIVTAPPEGVAAASLGMAERPDLTPLLAQLPFPVLVIVGQFDVISPPEEMEAMAKEVANARFMIIPDAGHMAPMEQPDIVSETIRNWLQSLNG